jgi:hypothetical protein
VAAAAVSPAAADDDAPYDTTGGRLEADAALEGLPVRSITALPRAIYDPVPPGRLGPLFRIANRLHVRTRPGTVRQHLVFGIGDPWSAARARESLRAIRAQNYLEPLRIAATPDSDSVDVLVETRDVWSTIPEFDLETGAGASYGSIAFTERNLMGLGKGLSIAYRSDPTGISRSAAWTDPAVLGSRARFRFVAETGSSGAANELYAGVPFWAEDAPMTAFASWRRATSIGRLFLDGETGAEFDQRIEEAEVAWGIGGRMDGTVRRMIYSFTLRDRRLGPSRLSPGAPPELDGIEENLRIRRLAADLRVWHPHFVERWFVDRMNGIEDFDLGPSVGVKLGFAPRWLGSTADESYARFLLRAGADTPFGFGWTDASLSTRFRWKAEELVRLLEARWVNQSMPRQTLVAAASGAWGSRVARDWQAVVGGLNGLRAFPVHALAGRRLWRFNVEDRVVIAHDLGGLVNVGAAAFWDVARAWGPGAAGAGWHHGAGAGLRFAVPRISNTQVIRLDIAWPIEPTPAGGREPVFSFGSSQAF